MSRPVRTAALCAVGSSPPLRRVEIGWAGVVTGESIAQIAIGVLTYRAAGIGGLGLLVALQMLPSAALAPTLTTLGDRIRRERLMLGCDLARLLIALAAAVAADAHAGQPLRYAIAIGLALSQSTFNPAQRALVPLLVATPSELTATSAVTGLIQGIGQVAGPLLGGVVLALAGAPAALLAAACCFAVAVAADVGLPSSLGLAQRPTQGERPGARAGARAALGDARLRLVLGLFAAKNVGRGALNVLIVLVPLSLLRLDGASVGWLTAVIGAGGVIGGAAAAALVTRRRLTTAMAGGVALWGLAFIAIGALHDLRATIVALVVLGVGNAICDASGYSLVPRSTRDDLLIRVYGIHESVRAAAIAAGGALTAIVAAHGGVRDALYTVGAILVAWALAGVLLRRHDAPESVDPRALELLGGVALLGWLPSIALERLATKLVPLELAAGDLLVREGESGDRAFLIERGEVVVMVAGREIARLGAGDLVGEIALLRSVPRTATVLAGSDLRVLALDRSEFLVAATGAPDARSAAEVLVSERLAQQGV
ncbi:MAG TPA: cyclic nucleotide-binding domain-containing protein [Gaiellales bacterium]